MTNNEIDLYELKKTFPFKTSIKVQFHQVDSFRIMHNIQYFYAFENARVEFLQFLKLANSLDDLIYKFPVMTVHHSIDYFYPAFFGEELEIFTKVSHIGKSSIKFENIAVRNNVLLCKAETVYVYIDPKTGESKEIPENIRKILLTNL